MEWELAHGEISTRWDIDPLTMGSSPWTKNMAFSRTLSLAYNKSAYYGPLQASWWSGTWRSGGRARSATRSAALCGLWLWSRQAAQMQVPCAGALRAALGDSACPYM